MIDIDCKLVYPEDLKKFSKRVKERYRICYYHEMIHVAINRFFHSKCYVRLVVYEDQDDIHAFTHYESTHRFLVLFAILFHFLFDFFAYYYEHFFLYPIQFKMMVLSLFHYKNLLYRVIHPKIVIEDENNEEEEEKSQTS